jgi:hypothetical protein
MSSTTSSRPSDCTADEHAIMRQAFAGVIWGKQYYGYDVGPLAGRRPRPAAAARARA